MTDRFPSWGEGQDEVYIHPHPCTGTPYIAWGMSEYSSPEEVRDYANRLLQAAEWVEEWDRKQSSTSRTVDVINRDRVALLKSNPDEYYRRYPLPRFRFDKQGE